MSLYSIKKFGGAFGLALILSAANAAADGIVAKIVNSPLSSAGLVRDAHTGINIYLQSDAVPGDAFMSPDVIGYGVPAGGRIEIELGGGFERDPAVAIGQPAMMIVTGAPQQGLPGKAVGYQLSEGATPNTIVVTSTKPDGLPAETLMSPAPGAKMDQVRQRGIKVFHVGFMQNAFLNRGDSGTATVRILDANGAVLQSGSAEVAFSDTPAPQIQPSNMPDAGRNHNWQKIAPGEVLGVTAGTAPIPLMLYKAPTGAAPATMSAKTDGLIGVGVVSTQQLNAIDFFMPDELARYNGGLILQDTNGDGRLDPEGDKIIGGVIGKAPAGAKGQELRSLVISGAVDLSRKSTAFNPNMGKRFGGAIALLQFTGGSKPGLYQPTLALLKDPEDLSSGDGSSYTYTIEVK